MDIGEAKNELLNGNLITIEGWGTSTYLKLIDNTIFKFIIRQCNVWNPTNEDILRTNYKLYNI